MIAATKRHKDIEFENYKIIFVKLNATEFFGFDKITQGDYFIFLANDEKLLIDCLLHERFAGNFDEIIKIVKRGNLKKDIIIEYLKKINNISLIKKVGFILDKYKNIDISNEFKINDKNYIRLLRNMNKRKISSKWRIYYDN